MSDLNTLARAATGELLERTTPNVRQRYADLRRMRGRRVATELAAAVAVVALVAGGWQVIGSLDHSPPQPAPRPGEVINGVLLGVAAKGPSDNWRPVTGDAPGSCRTTSPTAVSCSSQPTARAWSTSLVATG